MSSLFTRTIYLLKSNGGWEVSRIRSGLIASGFLETSANNFEGNLNSLATVVFPAPGRIIVRLISISDSHDIRIEIEKIGERRMVMAGVSVLLFFSFIEVLTGTFALKNIIAIFLVFLSVVFNSVIYAHPGYKVLNKILGA